MSKNIVDTYRTFASKGSDSLFESIANEAGGLMDQTTLPSIFQSQSNYREMLIQAVEKKRKGETNGIAWEFGPFQFELAITGDFAKSTLVEQVPYNGIKVPVIYETSVVVNDSNNPCPQDSVTLSTIETHLAIIFRDAVETVWPMQIDARFHYNGDGSFRGEFHNLSYDSCPIGLVARNPKSKRVFEIDVMASGSKITKPDGSAFFKVSQHIALSDLQGHLRLPLERFLEKVRTQFAG